ncbi:helix-turn-helix domain-containing protein [Lactococcus kimchii]|uniref:helix-turn-helix domain-containing protein n=1 Tax=Lactococcus sp. S-13 TaxID=2507158 RepID=UPI001CC1D452|nr:helix-turn-helix transcriptional regulator [Lactococcus sp. S-13]
MLFYDRLKSLVVDSHKSFNQIERELGYPRNALANYRLGKEPSAKRLAEIADYFDVTTEYLLGKGDDYNYKKAQLLFEYLSQEKKQNLLNYIEARLDEVTRFEQERVSLNVEQFVHKDADTWVFQPSDKIVRFPRQELPDDYDVIFELVNEALQPAIPSMNGDLVFIKFTEKPLKEGILSFSLEANQLAKLVTNDDRVLYLSYLGTDDAEASEELSGKVVKVYRSQEVLS